MKQRNSTRKYIRIGVIYFVLSSILSSTPLQANSVAEKKESSSITLDWKEFQSILKLDVDEVKLSWDEFTKLLSQTGFRVIPQYKVDGGNVILTREQFKKIIDQMKPPRTGILTPPRDYLIRKGSYNGVVGSKSTQFSAVLELEIFKKDRKSYLKIPLFREELAIEDIRFDEKPASIITEGGWHYLNTDKVGRHSVRVKFSVKSSLDRGTPGLNFNIPETPITYIMLNIPKTGIDVTIVNAQELRTKESGRHTIVKGYLTPTREMRISWKRKFERVARGPARIYAELLSLLSIEADAIKVTTTVKLNIVQNKITSITLAIPPGYQVLGVTGLGKGIWNVREEKGKELLDIPFEYPVEGNQYLTIKSEKLLPEETMVADFTGFEVIGAKRESGFIAGEVKSGAEAHIQEFEGLDRIDFQKIPQELSRLSQRPILFAFKYIRHPYNIVVSIIKYEREEALSAIIDCARGITLFLEDGKLVHQFTFSMQNLWNQFLKLKLPEEASIWSVYVDGKREKPSKDSDGMVLIPLVRSQREGEGGVLRPFVVELIYTEPAQKFAIFGKKEHIFPAPDVLINKLEWDIYLPENYNYIHFGGDLKRMRERVVRVTGEISLTERGGGVLESDEADLSRGKIEVSQKEIAKAPMPVHMKREIALGTAGLLSVRVDIPISGEKYLFSKKIVEKGELLRLNFTYMNERIINGFIILLILIVLFILFKIRRILASPIIALGKVLSKLPPLIKKCFEPRMLPIVILLLFIITILLDRLFYLYSYFPLLPVGLVFLFIISLIRLFKNQTIQVLKFLLRPSVSLLIIALLLAVLIRTRLFLAVLPLFLLLFIGFIVSIIRLIISFVKERRNGKEEKDEERK
ncbi:hypothetical protein KAW48_06790 [candidate division WOR-3 bacterium]|nr:hypothetical protein [candidate division WOR-3 bacterium]